MSELLFLDADRVTALTPWPALVDALGDAFRGEVTAPVRHHHAIPGNDREDITLLLMPAWERGGDFGVKLAAVAPSNAALGHPTLHGVYVLFCGATGRPRAVLDAGALTARRTAAASALASRHLSRPDSRVLVVVGTGRVARQLAEAHCSVRPIEEVRIWGRTAAHARDAAAVIGRATGIDCRAVPDLEEAVREADIVSSAVPSRAPLLRGAWVGRGTHVDLVGAFRPEMCEADADLVGLADRVFVDTVDGAKDEAGDLIQAVDAGRFSFAEVRGDLALLCSQGGSARCGAAEITLFKSVGTALEDLAAAQLCLRRSAPRS